MIELSIVMLAYNQPELEKQTIESLLKTTQDVDCEIIVVVQTPKHPLIEWFKSKCVVIECEKNVGIPKGWNMGANVAKGEYLCFANSDIICPTNWFPRLKSYLDDKKNKVGCVSPSTDYARGSRQQIIHTQKMTELRVHEVDMHIQKIFSYRDAEKVKFCHGFFFMTKKEIFERVGEFDEGFGLGFYEEYDWNIRLQEFGYLSVWAKDVFIHHIGNQTFNKMRLEENFDIRNKRWHSYQRFINKHSYRFPEEQQRLRNGKKDIRNLTS